MDCSIKETKCCKKVANSTIWKESSGREENSQSPADPFTILELLNPTTGREVCTGASRNTFAISEIVKGSVGNRVVIVLAVVPYA